VRYLRFISAALSLSMMAALVACSSSSNGGGGGGGNNPISVSISGAPATLDVNTTAAVTATVANDSANAGVTWSCAPAGSCGSFNPTSTASGTATTYTAPSSVPSSAVTITATSVTDTTKAKSASVTITQPAIALADGNYVFSLGGSDLPAGNSSTYFVAGVFTVSGGQITGGEQDFVDDTTPTLHDLINSTGNALTTTADGNLQITLNVCLGSDCTQPDLLVGVSGVETINGALVTAAKARITEFDVFATSSGTLELQDPTAATTATAGGYAFALQGSAGSQTAIGGILNISGTTISTTGTVFDLNHGGTVSTNQSISAGTISAPDASGRLQISITPSTAGIGVFNAVGYIVDSSHIQLVEGADQFNGTTGGTALAQNSANLAVAGNSYVFGLTGQDGLGPFQAAGVLTLAPATNDVTGTVSYNDLVSTQASAAAITGGTYLADTTNPGRVTLTGVTDGTNTFDIELYVDGNGNALALTLDTADVLEGSGYLQAAGSFGGSYAVGVTGFDGSTNFLELDAVGTVTTGTNTFSGTLDLNWLGSTTTTPGVSVTGAFTTPSGGVSTGAGNTLTGLDVLTVTNADAFDYYVVDSTKVIGIEIDNNQNTLAIFELVQ
jgi:hypothetical protein